MLLPLLHRNQGCAWQKEIKSNVVDWWPLMDDQAAIAMVGDGAMRTEVTQSSEIEDACQTALSAVPTGDHQRPHRSQRGAATAPHHVPTRREVSAVNPERPLDGMAGASDSLREEGPRIPSGIVKLAIRPHVEQVSEFHMSRRRPSALMLSGLAIVAAVVAVIAVAAVSGVSLNRVFEHFRPGWIIVVAIAEAVSFCRTCSPTGR